MIKKLTFTIILILVLISCSKNSSDGELRELEKSKLEQVNTNNIKPIINTELIEAIQNGNLEIVKLLIEKGADINDTFEVKIGYNTYYMTPLIYSSYLGNLSLVKYLVENGANVNAKGKYGDMALGTALEKGHLEIVKYLIEHGADINAKGKYGDTALKVASEKGHLEMVNYLVEHGADVNTKGKYDDTALRTASEKGHLEIVKYLAEHRADVNAESKYGDTALGTALEKENLEMVKYLVGKGADINAESRYGNTALEIALEKENWGMVKYLAEKGADVNAESRYGNTALRIAAEKENWDIVKYLIEKGADINSSNNTALIIAAEKGNWEMVKYLVKKGADINIEDYGKTALIRASETGNFNIVKYLVENGANINASDNTALRVVLEKENWEIAKYLIEHGADINTEVHGKTALIRVSENGNFDMVKYLVEKGADINATYYWDGISALMYASTMGYSQIVKYLIEKGADKETESGNSQEPKLTQKYLFAALKGKIDGKHDITINIQISDVNSLINGATAELTGNYHYDIFEKNISFYGYIDENSMVIEAEGDEVFTFKLDEETWKKILELKNIPENITINGTWEYKSKSFPCVINSVSPLGGKLSEIFEYRISNAEYDDGKNILYSPSMNVSYFGNDTEKIDIKNLKNIYERKLKKVVRNETYTYSDCSSEITYFDNKILCIQDYLTLSESEIKNTYYINHDYNIISLETGKKLNNTLADLVDYDEIFIEFLTKEYKDYFKAKIEFAIELQNMITLFKDLDIPESEQLNDFNFPEPTSYFPEDFDLPEEVSKSKFIFNNDGTITIYNDWLPTITKGYSSNLSIDMKKLKPYIKKDSFYRYLFD